MPKLKDFFTTLANKAGLNLTDEAVAGFFNQIPDVEVPEAVQTGIDNSLISIKDAKNNHPDLKNHYHRQVFDTLDKSFKGIYDEYPELSEDAEINEANGYKKYGIVASKIAALVSKKAAATNPKDKAEVQKEIDTLHRNLAEINKLRADEKKSFEDQVRSIKTQTKLESLLSKHKTIHDDLDPEVKNTVMSTILTKALQDNAAKFELDENGNIVLLKNDGTNYYGENHQQIAPAQFIEQTLAKNKLLKVTSNGSNGAPTQNRGSNRQPIDGTPENPNAAVIGLNDQAIQDYKNSEASGFGIKL